MHIAPIFAWYDFWVGLFWDQHKRRLYVFPFPMCGVMIQFGTTPESDSTNSASITVAHRCAEMVKGGADIQRAHAEECKRKGRWTKKEMSVSESGTEAYLTAANALDFWAYQIRREFGLLITSITDEQKAAAAEAIFDNDYSAMGFLKESGRWINPTPKSDSTSSTTQRNPKSDTEAHEATD